jgi:hypothetical protein
MINHIDTCFPDYFPKHNKTTLQVPVHREMTKKELTEAIINEYNLCYDHYVEYGDWPELEDEELEKSCDELILVDQPFKGLEPRDEDEDEDSESVYAYFIWED